MTRRKGLRNVIMQCADKPKRIPGVMHTKKEHSARTNAGGRLMAHLFVNRPRLHGLFADSQDLRAQFRWESVNAILYVIGGAVFILGSVLFFPALERYADLGAWTFFGGSLLYLVVTMHDMAEVLRKWRDSACGVRSVMLELTAAGSYLTGTILFTVGSVFFLSTVGWYAAGAWCFVLGSLLFVLGAGVNVLQIGTIQSRITLQLMNLTAVTFVVGSVLFTVASVPYLWHVENQSDHRTLYSFLALQYLIGSVLFFLGGVFNYRRAYLVMLQEVLRRRRVELEF